MSYASNPHAAPLTAITAAAAGVVLNLTVFFGYHVLRHGAIRPAAS